MHVYLYDSFLNQKKYDRILARLETRITDLGLNGRICRLGAITNVRDIVDYEIKQGAKTIVAVGNDQTVNQILNVTAGHNVPLGIVPIEDDNNDIAKALGITDLESACNILSARRITSLDLGVANTTFFLFSAAIVATGTIVEVSQDYSIEIQSRGQVIVKNLAKINENLPKHGKFNPQDGMLELLISTNEKRFYDTEKKSYSVFPIKNISISNNRQPLIIDSLVKVKTPAEISVLKQKLKVIVGRERNF
jgi:type III secretion system FlhB-like substrate exporter